MAKSNVTFRNAPLAVALVAAMLGCAACPPGECDCVEECPNGSLSNIACAIYHGTLADDVVCGDGCLSQGHEIYGPVRPITCGADCARCEGCALCPFGLDDCWCKRPQPGPPPVRLRPAMPPKFLPVPTEPMLSPVRPDAPEAARGDVEAGFRPQLTFPGRD